MTEEVEPTEEADDRVVDVMSLESNDYDENSAEERVRLVTEAVERENKAAQEAEEAEQEGE
jgi:hypothetical protein